ncbi:MAG: hypothetical protein UT30_C0009G0051 [Candidatus Uhrbacteria bacterium GW2011_GWF2_39_13]|uniref:Aminoacyl-transfer RNA synthetases class-II family profile domain-containing protein n=1 Tax=Candidatus Uhrbacteria bacterium GW2011_GWF2_39_13 TaxID=1618995 RepID=A0A0G0MV79_9BACT|nr:MAG: hypothetical protein UT30_C0009G0051 [Candidatus Uhrbacteria bacterium GW2011_GWF2_39_13]
MNHRLKRIAQERQEMNERIRLFFRERGYLEVETPILVASPGMEPNLTPFETVILEPNRKKHQAALITSPEYSMKKLLGNGFEKIFTITKVFRNEESLGGMHNPEFTMLEWYQQGADYHACMDETQELLQVLGFQHPIERVRLRDLFLERVQIDLDHIDEKGLQEVCQTHGIIWDHSDTLSDLFYRLFLEKIEPTFKGRNLFVYDYPYYQAALAALTPDARYGQRFELYLNGLELCNGFTELNDAVQQRERFNEEALERQKLEKPVFPIDEELLRLLPSMHTPTFGNALGIDRLHMALKGYTRIQETLLFPGDYLFY